MFIYMGNGILTSNFYNINFLFISILCFYVNIICYYNYDNYVNYRVNVFIYTM